ncbi:PadR family transcriptional regulator [Nonomuraea fuscirosea]|uniref:PadR family transcriptional regulator n=1 Tax=Nonomuraea fuscirosea TaxID=1291556 RepID=UPI0033F5C265
MGARQPKLTRTLLDVVEVLLKDDDQLYGLKIAQATGLMTGTVYPILARLVQARWVTAEWETADSAAGDTGARRKFYKLTPDGRQKAQAAVDARDKAQRQTLSRRTELGLN